MTEETPRYLYFNARARGELPRLVAAATGLKITNDIIPMDNWEDLKPKTPFGQVPCLVVGETYYAQKLAIAHYLAEISNKDLLGKTPLERMDMGQNLLFCEDVLEMTVMALVERDFLNKGTDALQKLKNEVFPAKLALLEKQLQRTESVFFVGGRLTLADLSCFDVVEHVVDLEGDGYLDKYPSVKAHFEHIASLPGIKEWRTNGRSKTPAFPW